MPDQPRKVSGDTLWRVTRACVGRMACEYGDPTHDHRHAECIRDDEAYAADLVLRLVAAVVSSDDDKILDRLGDVTAAIDTGDPTGS